MIDVARLNAEVAPDPDWVWSVSTGSMPLAGAPNRCLDELARLDRTMETAGANFTLRRRYEAVEHLLDSIWHSVVAPLLAHELGKSLRLGLPNRLLRLPLATATDARTGESLIHLTEPVVQFGTAARPDLGPGGPVVRIDGHGRDVARALVGAEIPPNATVLLMGCRTAELVPLLAGRGAGRAIVTSWDVEDRHCGPIADAIEGLLRVGLEPAEALRSVQAYSSWRHPYEWAGYSVVELGGAA